MFRRLIGQVFSLLLAASLVGGPIVGTLGAAATGGDASATSLAAPLSTSSGHRGCGDQLKIRPSACNFLCATAVALPSLMVEFEAVPLGRVGPTVGPVVIDHVTSPQPHPPKSA